MEIEQQLIFDYVRELAFGLSVMALVLIFNGYFYSFVMILHSRLVSAYAKRSNSFAIFAFVGFVVLIAIIQLLAIGIWAVACKVVGVIPSFQMAILYSGSCFTTIGIYSDPLLVVWKTVPLLMAMSGLFSFAWATAIMIAMATDLKHKLVQSQA